MYPFKQFLAKDIIISPLTILVENSFNGNNYFYEKGGNTYSWVNFFKGVKLTSSEILNNSINIESGWVNDSKRYRIGQVYNNIKQIYKLFQENNSNQFFKIPNIFPEILNVISISPQKYFESINPLSFNFIHDGVEYLDDGNGNILKNEEYVGNIFYKWGIVVIFDEIVDFTTLNENNMTTSFEGIYSLKEHQYKCVIGSGEFKHSLNPTLATEELDYKEFVNKPYFSPYITSVGLYNENKELLAVAKLPQPTPSSKFIDTTIILKFDE